MQLYFNSELSTYGDNYNLPNTYGVMTAPPRFPCVRDSKGLPQRGSLARRQRGRSKAEPCIARPASISGNAIILLAVRGNQLAVLSLESVLQCMAANHPPNPNSQIRIPKFFTLSLITKFISFTFQQPVYEQTDLVLRRSFMGCLWRC
jgi:hypothetical protein